MVMTEERDGLKLGGQVIWDGVIQSHLKLTIHVLGHVVGVQPHVPSVDGVSSSVVLPLSPLDPPDERGRDTGHGHRSTGRGADTEG